MDYRQNLDRLKKDFADGKRFTLFVGAGINAGKEVHLLWNELIREACRYSFRRIGQNMGLRAPEINSMLSLLGITDWDFDKVLPKTDDRDALSATFLEYSRAKDYAAMHFPVEIQVSIIKTLLGDSYIPFLQDYLYSQCNKDLIRAYFREYELPARAACRHENLYSLYVIARMILLNPQIESVISYNYDCFLSYAVCYLLGNCDRFFTEEEIRFLRRRYRVHTDAGLKALTPAVDIGNRNLDMGNIPNEAIRIYHVHGYIPGHDELQYTESPSIVLSMDEFFASLNDISSWSYTTQLNGIMTTNCLFVGSSLTDISVKRMLNMAKAQPEKTDRYVLDAHIHEDGGCHRIFPRDMLREIKNQYLEHIGVRVIDCDKGFHPLFSEIATITNVTDKP